MAAFRKPDNPQEIRQLPLPAHIGSECDFGGVSYLARNRISNRDITQPGQVSSQTDERGIQGVLCADRLEVFSADLDSCVLVDGFEAEHKAIASAAADQDPLHALKDAALYSDLLADYEVPIGFDKAGSHACAKGINVSIGHRDALAAISNDLEHSGGFKDADPFAMIDVDKEISREEGQDGLDALPVLPDPNGFVGGEERLYLAQFEVANDRFLVLRHGKNREPAAFRCLIASAVRKDGQKGRRCGVGGCKSR